MASLTPRAQNGNLVMPRDKTGNGLKSDLSKPMKTTKKPLGKVGDRSKLERKALGDLSNISKPRVSNRIAKDLSTEPKTLENTATSKKNYTLTKEEVKQCEEWAEEGIERVYFTGNDIQQLERDYMDKRVKEEVEMVMSSLHEWGNDMFDLALPVRDDFDDEIKLEFEPEILPPAPDKKKFYEEKLDQLLAEDFPDFDEIDLELKDFELKLKDFSDSD